MSQRIPVPAGKVNKLIDFFETDDPKPAQCNFLRRRSSQRSMLLRQFSSDSLAQKAFGINTRPCSNVETNQSEQQVPVSLEQQIVIDEKSHETIPKIVPEQSASLVSQQKQSHETVEPQTIEKSSNAEIAVDKQQTYASQESHSSNAVQKQQTYASQESHSSNAVDKQNVCPSQKLESPGASEKQQQTYTQQELQSSESSPILIEFSQAPPIEATPTLRLYNAFKPSDDAHKLKKALNDADSLLVIQILTRRTWNQRLRICDAYYETFGELLSSNIRKTLHGDLRSLMLALLNSPYDFVAKEINKAMKGLGTDETALSQLICTLDENSLRKVCAQYLLLLKCELSAAIERETSGALRKVFLNILKFPKSDHWDIDLAKKLAKGDKDFIAEVMTLYDQKFLRNMFHNYNRTMKNHFQDLLKKTFSGHLLTTMLTIYNYILQPHDYFAKSLHKAMKGLGTDESTLIRIITLRAEIDLETIKWTFKETFNESLESYVKGDTSGYFQMALLSLLGSDEILQTEVISQTASLQQKESKEYPSQTEEISQHPTLNPITEQPEASSGASQHEDKQSEESLFLQNILADLEYDLPNHFHHENDVPTVSYAKCFEDVSIHQQVIHLHEALHGKKINYDDVIFALTKRNYIQRHHLIAEYESTHAEKLCDVFKKTFKGDFLNIMLPLLQSRLEYLATLAKKACQPKKVDAELLIEILCSMNEEELRSFKECYKEMFDCEISQCLKALEETEKSQRFFEFLVDFLKCDRLETPKSVFQSAMYKLCGTKPSSVTVEFLEDIMKNYSWRALYQVIRVYETQTEHKFSDLIAKLTSGLHGEALLIIYHCVMNRYSYYAGVMRLAMKGCGTNESALIRILVSRCETDLENIKHEFQQKYQLDLKSNAHDETSGHFRDALLSLIEGNKNIKIKANLDKQDSLVIHENVDSPTQKRVLAGVLKAQEAINTSSQISQQPITDQAQQIRQNDAACIVIDIRNIELPQHLVETQVYPTIFAAKGFIAEKDADILCQYIQKVLFDEKQVINILTKRSRGQCQDICRSYSQLFGKNLISELKKKLSGDLENLLVAYVTDSYEYLAAALNRSLTKSDLSTIAEILFSMSPKELKYLESAYEKCYKAHLHQGIRQNVPGDLGDLIAEFLEPKPWACDELHIPQKIATQIANDGCTAGRTLYIISQYNDKQLLYKVFHCYQKMTGKSFIEDVHAAKADKATKIVLTALYEVVEDIHTFLAKKLRQALEGLGTDELALNRLIVSRGEIDLGKIIEKYQQLYGKTLLDDVKSDTSGNYRRALLSIINGNLDYQCTYELQQEEQAPEMELKEAHISKADVQQPAQTTFSVTELYDDIVAQKTSEDTNQEQQTTPTLKIIEIPPPKYEERPLYLRGIEGTPTMQPYPMFNASSDVALVRKATKGLITDDKTLIDIFTNRDYKQRVIILDAYHKEHGKALIPKIKKKLTGNFELAMVFLLTPRIVFLAQEMRNAMKGLGTNEETLAEILCATTPNVLKMICEAYHDVANKDLKDSITDDTSGKFKDVLIQLIETTRKDPACRSPEDEARLLLTKGPDGAYEINVDAIQKILTVYNHVFVYDMIHYVNELCDQTFSDAIQMYTSGDLRMLLTTLYQCITNRYGYFANRLHEAMKGKTDERTIARIIIWRSEIDLQNIKEEYCKLFGSSLVVDLQESTSGNFRKAMMAMLEAKDISQNHKK